MARESFDEAATNYDESFSNTNIGKTQRKAVWEQIDLNNFPNNSNILELNCGTGEDAKLWQEREMNIFATDISEEMIRISKSKFPQIQFDQRDIKNCKNLMAEKDILFSNFGGFNCLADINIQQFFVEANSILQPNSTIILVLMGKKCILDNLFLLLKGKFKLLGRRNTKQPLKVAVGNVFVETWYYSPTEIIHFAGSDFEVKKIKPIGLFVPPSYLSNWFSNKTRLLTFLEFLDRFTQFKFLANYADHFYIQFTKRN